MATKSSNSKGNPYHDEKTGKFTSAGVSAIKEQIETDDFLSDKELSLNSILSKYNNFYDFLNNERSAHKIRDFIDNYGSVPSFMARYGNLLKYALKQNVILNHNDGLDKIGVDLICHDGNLEDISIDNIYEKMNFIDIKTTFRGRIKLMAIQLTQNGLVEDGLANPKKKVNNMFAFQFFDGLDNLSDRAIAKKMVFQDMYSKALKPNSKIASTAYLLSKEKLYNAIYQYMPQENIKEAYDLVQKGVEKEKDVEQMFRVLCSSDSNIQISNNVPGIHNGVLNLGDGIALLIKSDVRDRNKPVFEVSIQLTKAFLKRHFANSELSYANIKNNKLNS